MNRILNVAKMQIINTHSLFWVPLMILAGTFLVNILVALSLPGEMTGSGGGQAPLWYFLVFGIQLMNAYLPFSLALGITRREFILGSILTGLLTSVCLAVVYFVCAIAERATSGWGLNLMFFDIPWIWDDGSIVALLFLTMLVISLFTVGFTIGAVYKRWGTLWLTAGLVVLGLLAVAAIFIISKVGAWMQVLQWFVGVGPMTVLALLAALCVLMAFGSYAALRRITVR